VSHPMTSEGAEIESIRALEAVGEVNVRTRESDIKIAGVMIIAVKSQIEKMTDPREKRQREEVVHLVLGREENEATIAPTDTGLGHRNIRSGVEGSVLIEKEVVDIVAIDTIEDRVVNPVVPIISIKKGMIDLIVDDTEVVVTPLIVLIRREGTDVEGGGGTRGRNLGLSVFTALAIKLSLNIEVGAEELCGLMRRLSRRMRGCMGSRLTPYGFLTSEK